MPDRPHAEPMPAIDSLSRKTWMTPAVIVSEMRQTEAAVTYNTDGTSINGISYGS